MGNVKVIGELKIERKIKDMEIGEEGYTVPWAYDANNRELNEDYPIIDIFCGNNAETASMKVQCINNIAGYKNTITPPENYKFH